VGVKKTRRIVDGSKRRISAGDPRVKYETCPAPADSWGGCGSDPRAKIAPRARTRRVGYPSDIRTRG
jgi:hypothetical protein